MKVILKFRQVHVDRSHPIDAVFPNLIEELRHFRASTVCRRTMICEMKSQRLEAGQEGAIHLSRTAARGGIYCRADRAERGRLFGRISS